MTTLVPLAAGLPVGVIVPFGGPLANIPTGFLPCNGASINRNDFADLFASIGTSWGALDGLSFSVPYTLGMKLRGVAHGSGHDPDRNTRSQVAAGGNSGDAVGTWQGDSFSSHNHAGPNHYHAGPNHRHNGGFYQSSPTYTLYGFFSVGQIYGTTIPDRYSGGKYGAYTSYTAGNTGYGGNGATSSSGGNQNTGRNVYVEYIIKY